MNEIFSPDRKYRYRLERRLFGLMRPRGGSNKETTCCFVMLNPSTADEQKDDPTIRRCKSFVGEWGYTRLIVVNLFALRSPFPEELYKAGQDAVGADNDANIMSAAMDSNMVLCAWGDHGSFLQRGKKVRELLRGMNLYALNLNKGSGEPSHPLYLPKKKRPFAI